MIGKCDRCQRNNISLHEVDEKEGKYCYECSLLIKGWVKKKLPRPHELIVGEFFIRSVEGDKIKFKVIATGRTMDWSYAVIYHHGELKLIKEKVDYKVAGITFPDYELVS